MIVNTLARQLLFCTVRITNKMQNGKMTSGTGFFFDAATDASQFMPLIITNKHVLANAAQIVLHMIAKKPDENAPDLGKHFDFTVGSTYFVGHPDPKVDVAVLSLTGLVDVLANHAPPPFFITLGWETLPTAAALPQFDAIEQLTFVGYPAGLSDPKHRTPFVRQAVTATPLAIPYGGDPTFFLDGAVFGGSSGSPVFIFNAGSWTDVKGTTNIGSSRLFLVGIVAENRSIVEEFPVRGLPTPPPSLLFPTLTPPLAVNQPSVRVAQALDLGLAFSSTAIIETINHALKLSGFPPCKGLADYK